jgi:hypothetical protein
MVLISIINIICHLHNYLVVDTTAIIQIYSWPEYLRNIVHTGIKASIFFVNT